jgi:hypothetical protein
VWPELTPEEQQAMAKADWSGKKIGSVSIQDAYLPHLQVRNTLLPYSSWKSVTADDMQGEKSEFFKALFNTVSLRRARLEESQFLYTTLRHVALDGSHLTNSVWTSANIDTHTFFDGAQGLETMRWPRDARPILLSPDTGEERENNITAIGQTPLRHPTIHDAYLVGMRLDDGSTHIQCRSFVGSEEAFREHIDTEVPKNYQKTHRLSLEFLHFKERL